MTLIATQVKRRRGTTSENDAFTGAEGEITVDLTTHELRVHDGSTVGGHTIPTKTEIDDLLSNKANVALDNLTNAGKEVCAHMAMPTNRWIDLTIGASDSLYTAPADGWMLFMKSATNVNQWIFMGQNPSSLEACGIAGDSGWCRVFFPVRKGDTFKIAYTAAGAEQYARFIYAEGAQ